MSNMKILMNGLIKENPTFVLLLGMCPTLATTTSAINGLSMGLATMAVLVCTNFVISCIKKITPDMVRIPVFIVVIAAFVTILQASETPGLGAKATTWFQKDGTGSIIGKTPKDGDLHVSKDDKGGNAVDAITASTITSRAFLKAINQAYAAYAGKNVDGESGASQKADAESRASKVEHNEKKG